MRAAYGMTLGLPVLQLEGLNSDNNPMHWEEALILQKGNSLANSSAVTSKTMSSGPRQVPPRFLPTWKLR